MGESKRVCSDSASDCDSSRDGDTARDCYICKLGTSIIDQGVVDNKGVKHKIAGPTVGLCIRIWHLRVGAHTLLIKNKMVRLPRELWMMILDWKRRTAWIERRQVLWRCLSTVTPYETGVQMLGIEYWRSEYVEFITIDRPDEIVIEQMGYLYNGRATRIFYEPRVVVRKMIL